MNDIVESYAWCMVQVTLLSAAAAGVYLLLRLSQMSGRATLLAGALLAAIALTLASASPWPRWNWGGQELIADVVIGNVSSEANAISSQAPQIAFDASALTLKQVAESAESEEVALPVRPAAEAASPSWSILLVFGAWAACVVGMLRLAIGVVQLRRCRRQSVAVDDEELPKLMDELRVRYRIRRPRRIARVVAAGRGGDDRLAAAAGAVAACMARVDRGSAAGRAGPRAGPRRRAAFSGLDRRATGRGGPFLSPACALAGAAAAAGTRTGRRRPGRQRVCRSPAIRDCASHPGARSVAAAAPDCPLGIIHVTTPVDEENCHVASIE